VLKQVEVGRAVNMWCGSARQAGLHMEGEVCGHGRQRLRALEDENLRLKRLVPIRKINYLLNASRDHPSRFSSVSTMYLPMTSDAVAAGDGTLQTCTMPSV